MDPRASVSRVVGAVPGPLGGVGAHGGRRVCRRRRARSTRAGSARDHAPEDPLALRDPDYIRRTLPALRTMSRRYFRAEVTGLDNIPAEGRCCWSATTRAGPSSSTRSSSRRPSTTTSVPTALFHQLAHDLVFKVPGLRALVAPFGTVPASPKNMRTALDRGAALLVYPGGDHETYRPSWESSEIDFAGRTGFAELALELDVPIVPVVSIGGQETALFLGQGERVARLLQLHKLLRMDVAPVQIGPPWGVTVLDLPGRIPLPAKITIDILPPIDLQGRARTPMPTPRPPTTSSPGACRTPSTELADERTLPIIG